ncbi:MAG TPA: TetR/AcrR family transcriptional regulator [Phototrophicaceae bacterium]|jgi:TetR/AcrR family transcriptional repressor of lmrAB and yxaGH operons|nr:TetR/AcrR family transcriptional regulator [Phototrophicaceae bacterium]
MSKGDETKARLIETTADLITRQGYHATGLNQIVQESGTPIGSLYYHFKGGKDELVVAAMRARGKVVEAAMQHIFETASDAATSLEAVAQFLSEEMESSQYQKGCPIATVALEQAAHNDTIQSTAQAVYRAWQAQIAAFLIRIGYTTEQAQSIALFSLTVIEGGLVLSHAERSTTPLKQAIGILINLLQSLPRS